MNNNLEQYTIVKIKHLTMAIDQSAFTAIRDRLIEEKAMAEIALKAMQAKPVALVDERQGSGGFSLTQHGRRLNLQHGTEIYTTSPVTYPVIPDRSALRQLVDVVWSEAKESTEVPSTSWADEMIAKVYGGVSPEPEAQ